MKANEVNLNTFLRKADTQFVIPVYQRNYDWSETECAQLLNDIIRVGSEEEGSTDSTHFIGSIVFVCDGLYSTTSINQLVIIDGQQRLTTITLLLICLYHYAKQHNDEREADRINNQCLINQYASDDEQKLKLKASDDNDSELKSLIFGDISNINHDSKSHVIRNYLYFRCKLNENNIDTIKKGLSRLIFVEISLERGKDNEQRIFESLNSTGLDLTQSDLIRNYILMGLDFKTQKKVYNQYWEKIDANARDESKSKVSDFIRDYLIMKDGVIVKIDNVYQEYKKRYQFSSDITKLEESLSDLLKYSSIYNKLLNPKKETDTDISRQLSYISSLDINVSYPFIMRVYNDYNSSVISKETFVEILTFIQTFICRRFIIELPTNALNKIFANLYDKIDVDNYLTSLFNTILSRTGKQRIPTDEEIKVALKNKDIYNTKSKNRDYLLERLENFDRREYVAFNENITIEHIFPQQPDIKWKMTMNEDEYSLFQNKYLHTLGNLTWSGNNGQLGNKYFLDKRDMNKDGGEQGYSFSQLWLNRYLSTIDIWNDANYKVRTKLLIDRYLKIWTLPKIKLNAPVSTEINIFDIEDPTFLKFQYATFFGRKVNNKDTTGLTMTSLYFYVIKQLFDLDSGAFINKFYEYLAISNDPTTLRTPKPLNDVFYIETNLSNIDKLKRLKYVLNEFSLNDELAVTLMNDTNS